MGIPTCAARRTPMLGSRTRRARRHGIPPAPLEDADARREHDGHTGNTAGTSAWGPRPRRSTDADARLPDTAGTPRMGSRPRRWMDADARREHDGHTGNTAGTSAWGPRPSRSGRIPQCSIPEHGGSAGVDPARRLAGTDARRPNTRGHRAGTSLVTLDGACTRLPKPASTRDPARDAARTARAHQGGRGRSASDATRPRAHPARPRSDSSGAARRAWRRPRAAAGPGSSPGADSLQLLEARHARRMVLPPPA